MKALIVAEHDGTHLSLATSHALSAAMQLSSEITILVAGYHCENIAQAASRLCGIEKVLLADAPFYSEISAEDLATLILKIAPPFRYILAASTVFGKNFLPRVAALLDVAQISDVVEIIDAHTFVRPIYAGNAYQTVQTDDPICVLTVRTTAFKLAEYAEQAAPIETIAPAEHTSSVTFIRHVTSVSKRPELTQAKIVVAGGRGLQSKENFQLVEQLADCLGAAVGASRAAVDAGFVSNDYQIGQTGKVVAPELYIAIGISGAIQHLAGMKDSKVIVAINKDANAPIFQVADYGLVGDLFEIIPEICSSITTKLE
jgi:electron transfer flavoprotein alpha subunit